MELLHLSVMSVTRLRARSQVNMQDFVTHHEGIAKLIAKAPRLEGLLTFGAEVAMKAGKIDDALAYLERTKEFLDRERESLDRSRRALAEESESIQGALDRKADFNDRKAEFLNKYNSQIVQRQRIISACALPFIERLHSGGTPETVFADALAWCYSLAQRRAHKVSRRALGAGHAHSEAYGGWDVANHLRDRLCRGDRSRGRCQRCSGDNEQDDAHGIG